MSLLVEEKMRVVFVWLPVRLEYRCLRKEEQMANKKIKEMAENRLAFVSGAEERYPAES